MPRKKAKDVTRGNIFDSIATLAEAAGGAEYRHLRTDFETYFTTVFRDNKGNPIKLMPFHRQIIEAIRTKSRVLVNIFRGAGKSTLITVAYVSWRIGNDRDIRVIVACKNESLAKDFLRRVEKIMKSDLYKEIFGDLVPAERTGTWTDTEKIVTGRSEYAQGLTLLGIGAMAGIAGRRADLGIIDDCADAKNSSTAIQRGHLSTWFFEEMEPVMEPDADLVAVGTRWENRDIYSDIQESWQARYPDDFVMILMPVLVKNDKGDYESVWESRFPTEKMLVWWKNKPLEFSQQMMNNPVDSSLSFLQREWLDYNLVKEEDIPKELVIYFGVDPSWSTKTTADFAAICVGGKDPVTNLVYVLDIIREHCDPEKLWAMVLANARTRRPAVINMEANAAQSFLVKKLLEESNLNIRPVKTIGSKTERFTNMSTYFTTRRVKLAGKEIDGVISPIPALDPLFYEWTVFRGDKTSDHDDCLDALDLMLQAAAYGAPPIELTIGMAELEAAASRPSEGRCNGCGAEDKNLYGREAGWFCPTCLYKRRPQDPRGYAYQRLRRSMINR